MAYPDPHPGPYVVDWADWLPASYEDVPDHLVDLWAACWSHDGIIDAIWHGEWPSYRELTTGCRCKEAPGWYPGRPAAELCPLHGTHRDTCPGVRFLGRSWRSEGCGWRCPKCGATYTLTRAQTEFGDHTTQYGVHPRIECGPAFCDLLPPRPVMQWVRDDTQTNEAGNSC